MMQDGVTEAVETRLTELSMLQSLAVLVKGSLGPTA
jgi:hypothetical protein